MQLTLSTLHVNFSCRYGSSTSGLLSYTPALSRASSRRYSLFVVNSAGAGLFVPGTSGGTKIGMTAATLGAVYHALGSAGGSPKNKTIA